MTRRSPLPAAEIRAAAARHPPPPHAELAGRFGCSEAAISRIVRGVAQPEAGGPVTPEPRPRGTRRGPVVDRSIRIPAELAGRIDRARGSRSTTQWLLEAAEMRLQMELST